MPGVMGGAETYLNGLLHHLPSVAPGDAFTLLLGSECYGKMTFPKRVNVSQQKTLTKPDPRWYLNLLLTAALHTDFHSRIMKQCDADVVHYPFTVLFPPVSHKPTVLTFHDMQQEFYPAFFSLKERLYRARTYRNSAQRATRIIAISQHVKQCLVDRYRIQPEKIDVVYNGCNQNFRVIDDNETLQKIREKYKLKRPFMFYPAASWPHKNHVRLLDALALLVQQKCFDGQLVLTGIGKDQNATIFKRIKTLGLENHVTVLGYLPYNDLPYIYNFARMLVFPSLFEGFGIPLVEAMACGCPVLASNCTAIPEVIANAGALFDPTSIEDMSDLIWKLWHDEPKLLAMKQAGLLRAQSFTWEQTAAATMAVYQKSA
ncbi:glycosyltransferase family 4 protein [Trichlorobacter lovleyi]|nr:glycosyltransferase family 1 protein [Trichlorobacter lovleyi]